MATYPRIEVSVDVVALTMVEETLHALLVRRGRPPFAGRWALPGAWLEVDEDLGPAAARELHQQTGIALHPDELRQLGAYGDLHRDPRRRVVSIAHLAEVERHIDPEAGAGAVAAAWVPVADVLAAGAEPMAFDHVEHLRDGVRASRWSQRAASWERPEPEVGSWPEESWGERG